MQSRKNFYDLKGGDTVQLLKTKAELEKLGVEVDISLEYEPDLTTYDLVHLSNVTRIQETYLQMKNAKRQNKPVVLSTIYWPTEEFEKQGQTGIRRIINSYLGIDNEERLKALARYVKDKKSRDIATRNLWKLSYTKMQQYVVNNTDFFLPNSKMEMDMLCEVFGVKTDKYKIIPNAIDANVARMQDKLEIPDEFETYKNAVICVGRIEPRKNQLSLVRALDGSNYKLVLVGAVSDNQKSYFEKIKPYIERNPNFFYIPRIENDRLYLLYKVCKVSALPSWLDTPGLVSLEAGAMGCNLAISSKGTTREYFGDLAEYCLPNDIEGIRKAIDNAFKRQKNNELKERIFENYTWEIAASKTMKAYQEVLSMKG